ncbi:ComEC/Rec2 family competence protein [Miltoncostaea oceani]|uniref:ComEC/Rec2 family competence protein n=1 Tax=Miltoncostaea oceani TaxID=2843216 RepID=UPI001C3D14E6|nr:ComEC/Rec2 family competence protein [Miltoncostaea oceani]
MAPAAHPPAPLRLRLAPHLVIAAACAGLVTPLAVGSPPGPAALLCAAACLAAAGCAATGRAGAGVALVAVAALLAGAAWGAVRIDRTAPPALDLPVRVSGTVVVDTPPVAGARDDLRARGVVDRLTVPRGGAIPPGTRLLLDLPAADPPAVGTRLRVAGGRLRPASTSTSPGWWRRWLGRQGIAARLRIATPVRDGRRGGIAGVRDRWRAWAGRETAAGLSGDVAALVRGMALGGGSGLSEGAADAFRDAGIWHLLAVSGQNVAVVAVATLAMLGALGVARRPAVAGAAVVMLAYCLACDGGASVGRAGIVGALGLAAELRSAPRERWHLLLAGLALLLAHQPRAIADPGLQLSFAAVAGLFLIAPPLAGWLRGWIPGRVADLAAMAGAASLATAPVVVAHFGRLSLAGLLVNVVAVPLAAPIVVIALAGLAVGAVLPVAGVALAAVAGAGTWLLLAIARAGAAVPGAAVDLPAAAAAPLALLAVARSPWRASCAPVGRGWTACARRGAPWSSPPPASWRAGGRSPGPGRPRRGRRVPP